MPAPKPEPLIPVVKAKDPRYQTRGVATTPVVNMRMSLELTENPGFALDLGGIEAAKAAAEIIRKALSENYQRGLDARGDSLPAISPTTEKRRERRQRQAFTGSLATRSYKEARGKKAKSKIAQQHADTMGSYLLGIKERFRLRGKSPSGKREYPGPVDLKTPFHESGLASENVVVYWKGYSTTAEARGYENRGDPTFDIAWPTGGKERGLHNDDGKGARLFAVQHYGFERMADIPRSCEAALDQALDNYLSRLALVGGSLTGSVRQIWAIAERAGEVVEKAAEGEPEE